MVSYTLSLDLDADTRTFLKGHGYSLYLFKGINAGSGAASTVWQTINGSQLYDQGEVTIQWDEHYYIGETTTKLQAGAVVSGVNPYISQSNIQSVSTGKNYIYSGVEWNPNPTSGLNSAAFFIENDPSQTNSFYVSQQADSGVKTAIVIQEILGSGGNASFTPIEVIALILSTQLQKVGTIITQAFSPGAILTMSGVMSSSISYNKDTGWKGPSSQLTLLNDNAPVYQSLLQSYSSSLLRANNKEEKRLVQPLR